MLSRRVQHTLVATPMMEAIGRAFGNPYDPKTNEKGIISLGIAENTPMYPELAEFLEENMHITPNLLGYGGVIPGPPGLMNGLLGFINAPPFNPVIPVVDKHLYFTAGCTALLDQVFWTLCDEGEGILISMPMYGGFANDMQVRGKCNLLQVNLKGYDVFSKEAIVRYEEALLAAEKKEIKTRVLVLCTPHNPLGQCYSREVMIEYMRFCQKHQIHLVSDEIYALTTFPTEDIRNPTPFTSLLSIPKDNLIDPTLCHVLHGMSKDFCGNGIRFGLLISQDNPDLHTAIHSVGFFGLPSSLALEALSTILNHPTFFPEFLKLNRTRLIEHYAICTRFLRDRSIPYIPSNAGFYVWVNLTAFMRNMPGDTDLQKEREMTKRMLDGGVYLATAEAFKGEENGWYRITFTVEKDVLLLGLKRLIEAISGKPEVETSGVRVDKTEAMQRLNLEE